MKRLVKIVDYCNHREGVKTDGTKYEFRDVVVKWEENEANSNPYGQGLVVSVAGHLNEDVLRKYKGSDDLVQLTFFLDWREWQGKYFTNARGFLPKEFTDKDAPF